MAFTTEDLALITSAIAGGEKSVRYGDGRMVTYQDTDQMLRARDRIIAELGAASKPPRSRVMRLYQKGTGL
jgi:hypothetical protein